MDFKKIKKAVEILDENFLTEFSYEEKNGFKLVLKREPSKVMLGTSSVSNIAQTNSVPNKLPSTAKIIKAPLVGTYYSAPDPNAPSYIEEGDSFKKGDTLCIVEAMKVMNEVKAECDGTIVKIYLEDGDSVEYDQNLFEYK